MSKTDNLASLCELTGQWTSEHKVESWPDELEALFPTAFMEKAQGEISSWEGYEPTALTSLPSLAQTAGVGEILYKDESTRFGLGSFKALGGAYAVLYYLSGVLSQQLGREVTMAEIRSGALADEAAGHTVATATDGNHGRSVAWGAQQAGCKCRIYIHAEVSRGREEAMAAYGAHVIRIDGDYDESVRMAARDAEANGWKIISDTSYDGYMDIPRQVMAGYTIMVSEILEQAEQPPTHVIIQAGVGGLAAAMAAAFWVQLGENRPKLIVTESDKAACILASMESGKPTGVEIHDETIMAGLSCGEISLIAHEVLSRAALAVTTIRDDAVAPAMRVMADLGVEAGECGVPGIITLLAINKDEALKTKLGLDETSRVLVFGCEGATDPELYRSIIAGEA